MAEHGRDPRSAEQMKDDVSTNLFDLCQAVAEDGEVSLEEIKSPKALASTA